MSVEQLEDLHANISNEIIFREKLTKYRQENDLLLEQGNRLKPNDRIKIEKYVDQMYRDIQVALAFDKEMIRCKVSTQNYSEVASLLLQRKNGLEQIEEDLNEVINPDDSDIESPLDFSFKPSEDNVPSDAIERARRMKYNKEFVASQERTMLRVLESSSILERT